MSRSYMPALHASQFSKKVGEWAMNCCISGIVVWRITLTHCSLRSWSFVAAELVKICSLAIDLYTLTSRSSVSSRPWFMSP